MSEVLTLDAVMNNKQGKRCHIIGASAAGSAIEVNLFNKNGNYKIIYLYAVKHISSYLTLHPIL